MTDNPWDDLKTSDTSNSSNKKNKNDSDNGGCFCKTAKSSRNDGGDSILENFNNISNFFSSKFKITNSLNGFFLAISAVLFFWLLSGIYVVKQEESAIIMRFGKYNRTTNAGLHYHLPYPVETIVKEATTRVRMLKIGDNGIRNNLAEGLALTGDENIVNLELNVQWKIDDLKKFVFKVRDKQQTIYDATQSAIREVISKRKLADILTSGRSEIEEETKQLLQQMLNTYDIGISILLVQMLKIDPPSQVLDSFRDVQTARVDKESEINKAYKYKNDVLPKVKGEAGKILQDANGYAISVVNRAKGDASRFNQIYQQYKDAQFVTRKRMYLDAIEALLKGKNITIIDENVKNVFLNASKVQNANDAIKSEEIAQIKDLEENNS